MKKIISILLIMAMLPFTGALAENKSDFYEQAYDFYNNGANGNSQAVTYMQGVSSFFTVAHNETSPLGGRSAKFDFTNYSNEAQLNSVSANYDLSGMYDDAYLKFYMYIETASSENHGLYVSMSDRSYRHTESVYLPFELEYNKWNEVMIKLSDFGKGTMDWTNMYRVEFSKAVTATETFMIFVQGVEIVRPHILGAFCTQEDNGSLKLTWNGIDGEKYSVLRNGTEIASDLTASQYTDEAPIFGEKAFYRVRAEKGGSVVGYSEEIKAEAGLPELENNAVTVRSGSSEAYVNGERKNIDDFDSSVMPFVKDGTMYIPYKFCTDTIGVSVSGDTVLYDGISYVKAEDIANACGGTVYQNGDTAVITSYGSVPDWVFEKYADKLEYWWDNAKLGSYGYVTGMLIHPKNSDLKYVRTDVGGIYRYDSAHGEWKWISEDLTYEDNALRCVKAIAIDESNENVIYAAAGENGYSALMKSEDRGETWSKLNFQGSLEAENHMRLSGESLIVDPNNPNVIYCGTNKEGLWVSADGGENFSQAIADENITVVIADKSQGTVNGRTKVVYAGVYGKGVYRSTDGGASFTELSGGPLKPYRFQIVGGKLYASGDRTAADDTYNAGLFRYTGSAWEDITPPMSGGINTVGGFAVKEDNPSFIIAQGMAYRDNDMYRTTDGGKTWKNLGEVCYGTCHIVFDPNNAKGAYLVHGAGVSYISDATANKPSAVKADYGIEEICVNEVISAKTEDAPELFTSCMDKGLMVSETVDEYAVQATPYTYTGTGVEYCESAPQYMVKSGWLGFPNVWVSKGSVCVSSDYGRTWTKTKWNEKELVLDCTIGAELQQNGKPIIIIAAHASDGDALYRSLDFGETWDKLDGVDVDFGDNPYSALNHYLAADKADGNVFYFSCSGSFSSTTDGGDTWNTVSLPVGYNVITKALPGVRGEVWTICGDGLYRSCNCGASFEKVTTVDDCTGYDFGKGRGNDSALYVRGSVDGVFGVYVSEDMGKTYRLLSQTTESASKNGSISADKLCFGRVYTGTDGRGVLYAQSAYLSENTDASVSVSQDRSNNVNITWEYHGAYDGVRILCNDEPVATVKSAKYSYIPSQLETSSVFTVEFLDDGGNVLGTAGSQEIYVRDYFLTNDISIFENGSNCYTGDGVSLDGEFASPLGGNSICLTYPYGYNWDERKIQHDAQYDISALAENGYLSFYAYVDTDNTEYKTGLEMWNISWHRISKEGYTVDLSGAIGEWKEFLIPLSEIVTSSGDELKALKQLKFIKKSTTAKDSKVYLQDIAIRLHEDDFGAVSFTVNGENGSYKITAELANSRDREERASVIAAAYSGDELADLQMFDDIAVSAKNSIGTEVTYTVPSDTAYDKVRAFLFDKALIPLKKARVR